MKLNRSFSKRQEQLGLKFRIDSGLPLPVSPRLIENAARREFCASPDALLPDRQFKLLRYVEKVSMLRQVRQKYRKAAREVGGVAVYAGTPQGRRVHRAMQILVKQIAAERNSLCG